MRDVLQVGLAPGGGKAVNKLEYTRIDRWVRNESNGWASPAVAARFEAGTRGEPYLEYLPLDPTIVEQPLAKEQLALLSRTGLERPVLLDFGCGNAVFKELLDVARWTPEWSYIGADVNSMNVESCRRRFPDSRFEVVLEDAPLPFEDESVDIVIASGVFEALERPAAVLAEFGRITRAWVAIFRIGVQRSRSVPRAIYFQRVQHAWGSEEHCFQVFNRTDLDEMAADAGLGIVWEEASVAAGEWVAPDDPVPIQHFSYLMRKR